MVKWTSRSEQIRAKEIRIAVRYPYLSMLWKIAQEENAKKDFVTVQQVCALAALTVRKHRQEGKNPISEADLEWIFACNYEGAEQLHDFIICPDVPNVVR